MTNEIFPQIETASTADNPFEALEGLVYFLSAQGLTRQNIYDHFLQFHSEFMNTQAWLSLEEKFGGDHPVDLILDRLGGWCRNEAILLPNEPFI